MPRPRKKIAGQVAIAPQDMRAGDAKGAADAMDPKHLVPSFVAGHSLDETRAQHAGSGELADRVNLEFQTTSVGSEEEAGPSVATIRQVPPPPPLIAELIEWQRRRVHAIRAQSQCDRSCDAYVSRYLGYHSGLPQAERLALMKRAAKMRAEVEKSGGNLAFDNHGPQAADATDGEGQRIAADLLSSALAVCLPIIVNTIQSRAGWDAMRLDAERRMREIARAFPVYERCSAITGFGDLGLACIVAEAGNDLTAYPHYYHLWKRLGLAPFNGKAMSTYRSNELTKAEWSSLGYNPMRRGRMAGDVGAALFFNKARNDYGAIYAERRERTALTHPDWTPAHSDADARRVMLKALVADVWRWWQEAARAADLAVAAE